MSASVPALRDDERELAPDLHTGFSAPGGRPTPWEDVVDVVDSAELFWISTVRANGCPHVTPLPAVWRDGALYFCTGPGEQKALNLRANDQCALTTGDNRWKAGLDVVVEGRAERVTDDATLRTLAAMWRTKYDGDWKYEVRVAHVFEVRPWRVSRRCENASKRASPPRRQCASAITAGASTSAGASGRNRRRR